MSGVILTVTLEATEQRFTVEETRCRYARRARGLRKNYVGMPERHWPARLGQTRSVWFIWSLWLVWFNQIHKTNQTSQLNETDRTDQMNKSGWRTFSASC